MQSQHIVLQHCISARHAGYVGFPPLSLPHSPIALHRRSGQHMALVAATQSTQKGYIAYFRALGQGVGAASVIGIWITRLGPVADTGAVDTDGSADIVCTTIGFGDRFQFYRESRSSNPPTSKIFSTRRGCQTAATSSSLNTDTWDFFFSGRRMRAGM